MTPEELLPLAHQRLLQGDLRTAENFVTMVLEKHAGRADAWALAARIALAAGQPGEAAKRAANSLARQADEPAALGVRAALHQLDSRWADAVADYRAALRNTPHDVQLHYNQAICLRMLGLRNEALAAFERACELLPAFDGAWNNLGVLAQELGRHAQAIAAYRQALSLNEALPLTHNNLGTLLQEHGDHAAAEGHYQRAVALDPAYAVAWKNLGALYQTQYRYPEAVTAFDQAAAQASHYAEAQAGALHVALQIAQWEGLQARKATLEATLAHDPRARIPAFAYLSITDDPLAQRNVAERWSAAYVAHAWPARPREDDGRIRLGYLGGDFFSHATSWLTAGLFKGHERQRFEVHGYDYGHDDGSPLRRDIVGGFDRFTTLAGQSPQAIAERIRADGIDVLVDLKGWTRDTRAELLSLRPAPVQIHYLAYPGTLGAPWIDYLIADPIVAPPGSESGFSEALIRLPRCYQINDDQRTMLPPPTRASQGLPEQALVWCCFNQHYKIQPATFAQWMHLLHAVPDSVLWLMAGHPAGRDNLRATATQHGIDPARLIFAQPLPQAEHIARLALADIVLDTLPFNSHTTASDALWAGVPLVTQSGRSYASRVAASCLHAVSLAELVTPSPEGYTALALALAHDPARRKALREHLATQRSQSPLFRTPTSIAALESAYLTAWERHRAGLPPTHFDVPDLS